MWHKLSLLLHTVGHLKKSQLIYYVRRRYLPQRRVSPRSSVGSNPALSLAAPIATHNLFADEQFSFLNARQPLLGDCVDWNPHDKSRLWRYNLHYFDYLRQAAIPDATKAAWLDDWIAGNPQGSAPGWEPFTASLRIVNWIFFLRQQPASASLTVTQSLYTQTLWLEKNLELHILANHYFENLKALAFAGSYFTGVDAARWREFASREIMTQLEEQTLNDGGHYERTPQYHALMLENYLDLYSLTSSNPSLFDNALPARLKCAAHDGLRFLADLINPDGSLPLFNDTANGIAPGFSELCGYAHRVFGFETPSIDKPRMLDAPDSGYFGYRTASDRFIIDCGAVGPDYQPGHTHCDMLSYELMLGGQQIVVDTGVCEYEPGAVRSQLRGTAAHNTIQVDGEEQSEVWGAFRVARRAKVLFAGIEKTASGVDFKGGISAFPGIRDDVQHERRAVISNNDQGDIVALDIVDRLHGTARHKIESRIHLHPDVEPEVAETGRIIIRRDAQPIAELSFARTLDCRIDDSFYCPQFGVRQPNRCVVLTMHTAFPIETGYRIVRV